MRVRKDLFIRKYEEDLWGRVVVMPWYKIRTLRKLLLIQHKERKYKIRSKIRTIKRFKKRYISQYGSLMILRKKISKFYGDLKIHQYKKLLRSSRGSYNFVDKTIFEFERRLKTVVYRMNYVATPLEGEEKILSGTVLVNGRVITYPAYRVKVGDMIGIASAAREIIFKRIIQRIKNKKLVANFPKYMEVNYKILQGIILRLPKFKEIQYPCKLDIKWAIVNNKYIV